MSEWKILLVHECETTKVQGIVSLFVNFKYPKLSKQSSGGKAKYYIFACVNHF